MRQQHPENRIKEKKLEPIPLDVVLERRTMTSIPEISAR